MGKITFRADEDLVEAIEAFDASKSEVMRDALRHYLDTHDRGRRAEPSGVRGYPVRGYAPHGAAPSFHGRGPGWSIDEVVSARVDELFERRLERTDRRREPQDLNLTVTIEGVEGTVASAEASPTTDVDPAADSSTARASESATKRPSDGDRTADSTRAPPRDTASDDAGNSGRPPSDASARASDEVGHAHDEDRPCAQCGTSLDPEHVYCPNCGEKASRRLFCECGDEVRSDWSYCPSCGRRTPAAGVLDSG